MQKVQKTLPYLVIFLASSIALGLYGYLGSFTRFTADDYCSFTYANEMGLFKSILYWYRTWSGRYSAFGMDWLVLTKLFGRYSIQLVPPVTLLTWFVFAAATIYSYLKSLAPEKNDLFPAMVLAASSIYIILASSPNVPQSLYWWNGMRSYTLPLVILTIYTFFFQLITKRIRNTKQLTFWGTLSVFFLFASGGLSETYAVLQFVLLVFLLILKVISLPRKKLEPGTILLLTGILGTILSLIVIIAAPGNAIRQARLNSSADLASLVLISLTEYPKFVFSLFDQATKWSGWLGLVALTIWVGLQYKHVIVKPWKILAYFIGGFALSFACILPGIYGYSQMPPERTIILPVFIFAVFLLASGFYLGSWLSNKIKVPIGSKNGLIVFACASMIFSTSATARFLYESRGAYIAFAEKWDAVDAQILQAKAEGKEFVEIPDMTNWTGLDRPNQDAGFWLNECYISMYGIEIYGPPFLWQ
jgi:Family of unknown function (DUF6056)